MNVRPARASWLLSLVSGWVLFGHLPATSGQVVSTPASSRPSPTSAVAAPQSGLQDLERTVHEVIQRVSPAVVAVDGGSGVIISPDGVLVTVAHVVDEVGKVVPVTLSDGRRTRAVVLGIHRGLDAAVCKITEPGTWPVASMGDSTSLNRGDWVITLGYPVTFPRGQPAAVRVGRVIRKSDREITADCPIMGGDSGGALVDLQGRLVGIGARCDDHCIGINFFVSEQVYRDHWDRMVAGESIGNDRRRPRAGAPDRPLRPEWAESFAPRGPRVPFPTGGEYVARRVPLDAATSQPMTSRGTTRRDAIESAAAAWEASRPLAVEVWHGDTRLAMGCRWGHEGQYVVTKASLLEPWHGEAFRCRRVDGEWIEATWVGAESMDDVALLRLELDGATDAPFELSTERFRAAAGIPTGSKVELPLQAGSIAVSLLGETDQEIGIVMGPQRRFQVRQPAMNPAKARLGLRTRAEGDGVVVIEVFPGTAAEQAGIRVGDQVLRVDGKEVRIPEDLIQRVAQHAPGEKIGLDLLRNEKPFSIEPSLGVMQASAAPSGFDQWGGGPFSVRRFGFGEVWTHDSPLSPEECGGPLVDLSGNLIGVNIARTLRVASYAIPAARVDQIVERIVRRSK